ncbi:MAG: hypothetical protein AABX32_04785 [Nanoarchaeota archaeon]
MVAIFNYDVPNLYISGAVGGVFVIFLIWFLLRNKGGRLGEEKLEEKETRQLEADEKKAERAQKDEKKQCKKMDRIVTEIERILKTEGMGEIYDGVRGVSNSVHMMLSRMLKEKMSLQRAIETFKTLHSELNEFISHLPTDNRKISSLVSQLAYYQKREYTDLINELQMDRDKKTQLKKLWNQETDEETGTGNAAA